MNLPILDPRLPHVSLRLPLVSGNVRRPNAIFGFQDDFPTDNGRTLSSLDPEDIWVRVPIRAIKWLRPFEQHLSAVANSPVTR